jgi:ABC-type nitrate/sulfonate/bicarbonate transport system substrate-binding protein
LKKAANLAQSPDTIRAFVRAFLKGSRWARERTPEEAAAVMVSFVPTLKAEDVAKTFAYTQQAIPVDGCLSESGIMGSAELFKAAGLLKRDVQWTEVATNEFLPTKCT